MKTKSMNPENGQNKQEQQNKQSAGNWATGTSAAIGAAVGVVAGNVAQSAAAAEPVVEVEHSVVTPVDGQPEVTPVVEPDVTPVANVTPEVPVSDPNVTLVSCETVVGADGMPMDVAVFNVDGTEVAAVDIDRNGTVDAVVSDLNGDGILTPNEILDVRNENVQMADLVNSTSDYIVEDPTLVAHNDGLPDYTNNADVSDFMA